MGPLAEAMASIVDDESLLDDDCPDEEEEEPIDHPTSP